LECFAFDEMNCRLPVEFLRLIQLLAQEHLLALKVCDGLLNHPAQKVAGEGAFRVMQFRFGHYRRSRLIWRFIHQRRVCSDSHVALMLPIRYPAMNAQRVQVANRAKNVIGSIYLKN